MSSKINAMVDLSPNLRLMVKRVYQRSPDGTAGCLLEELDLGAMTPQELKDGWSILSREPYKLFEPAYDAKFQNADGKHPVRLTKQGRVSAREIIDNDDVLERQRAELRQTREAAEKAALAAKRSQLWVVGVSVIWALASVTVIPLIINHYDRRIQQWEERHGAGIANVPEPATRP
jgi:hypothetical protein